MNTEDLLRLLFADHQADSYDILLATEERLHLSYDEIIPLCIGYCHSPKHPGAVTAEIFEARGCGENGCPYLDRCYAHPFWREAAEAEKITLVLGQAVSVCRENVIAFCTYEQHPGGLTPVLTDQHECIAKECVHFERNMQNGYWKRRIKMVSGKSCLCSQTDIPGFCLSERHPGGLTPAMLHSHQCIEKNCTYFQRNYDSLYWVKKAKRIQRKQALKKQQEFEASLHQDWKLKAMHTANQLMLRIRVMRVEYHSADDRYTVFYISKKSYDDKREYQFFKSSLNKVLGGDVELRHIKNMDGTYAVY